MRDIAFLVYPGYSLMALAVVTGFEVANLMEGGAYYDLHFVSETGGPVMTSAGVKIQTEVFTDKPFDTLVVGGATVPEPATPGVVAFVRDALKRHRRIAAVCTGAFVLADAGLLDGRRATTHWAHARDMQKAYPLAKIDEDRIFINDGPIWTSAGMTAGIDLGLALIESDLGADISKAVARKLVIYHRRAGGQSQFSALLELDAGGGRFGALMAWMRENLADPLTVERLAARAGMSERNFARAFLAETRLTPAKAVERLRLEAARAAVEAGARPIDIIARSAGFGDPERMRRAFVRAFGQPPQALRRAARTEAA